MTPTHSEGLQAAKRVSAANDRNEFPDVADSTTMLAYHLSLELRRMPPETRLARAQWAADLILANTAESLD